VIRRGNISKLSCLEPLELILSRIRNDSVNQTVPKFTGHCPLTTRTRASCNLQVTRRSGDRTTAWRLGRCFRASASPLSFITPTWAAFSLLPLHHQTSCLPVRHRPPTPSSSSPVLLCSPASLPVLLTCDMSRPVFEGFITLTLLFFLASARRAVMVHGRALPQGRLLLLRHRHRRYKTQFELLLLGMFGLAAIHNLSWMGFGGGGVSSDSAHGRCSTECRVGHQSLYRAQPREPFAELPVRDVVACSSAIYWHARSGSFHQAIVLFTDTTRAGLCPNSFTLVGLLLVVARLGDTVLAECVHGWTIKESVGIQSFCCYRAC
jgi:hypothetical protein